MPPATGTAAGSKAAAKTYYRFDGWYVDAACTTAVSSAWNGADGSMAPTKTAQQAWIDNTTFYAKFVEETADADNRVPIAYEVVTFDAEGAIVSSVGGDLSSSGEKLAVLTGVPAGSTATARAGYTYEGWFEDASCFYDVPTTWVDARAVTPAKAGSEWAPKTYYAKMVVDVADIEVAGYTDVYDGLDHGVTVSGHLPTDELRYFVGGERVDNLFVDSTAGTDVAVEVWRDGVLVWSEATQGAKAHAEVVITPRPIEIVTGSSSRVYDGEALTNEDIAVTGLVVGEVLDAKTTGTITDVGSVPNSYDPRWGIEPLALEADGAKSATSEAVRELSIADAMATGGSVAPRASTAAKKINYVIVKETLGTLTIIEAEYEVSSSGYLDYYDGRHHGITVLAPADATVEFSANNAYKNVTDGSVAVDYTVTRPNYKTIQGTETVTVLPLTVTATADDARKRAGDADPELTYSFEGGIGEEIPGFAGVLVREPGEAVGSYPINQGDLAHVDNDAFLKANYLLEFVPGTLVVDPGPQALSTTGDPLAFRFAGLAAVAVLAAWVLLRVRARTGSPKRGLREKR